MNSLQPELFELICRYLDTSSIFVISHIYKVYEPMAWYPARDIRSPQMIMAANENVSWGGGRLNKRSLQTIRYAEQYLPPITILESIVALFEAGVDNFLTWIPVRRQEIDCSDYDFEYMRYPYKYSKYLTYLNIKEPCHCCQWMLCVNTLCIAMFVNLSAPRRDVFLDYLECIHEDKDPEGAPRIEVAGRLLRLRKRTEVECAFSLLWGCPLDRRHEYFANGTC